MSARVWADVGDVGAVTIRDFGRHAELGDYLVQGGDDEAGSDCIYGIGEDYVNEADTLLAERGMVLAPDHVGLRVVRVDES